MTLAIGSNLNDGAGHQAAHQDGETRLATAESALAGLAVVTDAWEDGFDVHKPEHFVSGTGYVSPPPTTQRIAVRTVGQTRYITAYIQWTPAVGHEMNGFRFDLGSASGGACGSARIRVFTPTNAFATNTTTWYNSGISVDTGYIDFPGLPPASGGLVQLWYSGFWEI